MLIALAIAGLVAGLAGAWSPCGFSMVDTLAPHGYAQRMRMTALACATFALGALVGGVATFGGLALLGSELGAGHGAAVAIAAALLVAAAAGDAAGRRIVPQVRRQVPEAWRRVLPLPLAAGLYGVLLGLGFTTFVLSFAVYALAAASLALADPAAGLAVGLGFAVGRIVPVVVLAPLQERERGARLAAAMGERPEILRAIRAAGAVALGAAALVLALGGAPAAAATSVLSHNGTDPSWGGASFAWQQPAGGAGLMLRNGVEPLLLPGTDPALGPDNVVWHEGDSLVVADQATLAERLRIEAPGVEEPAVSARWLVWRAREPGGDVLRMIDMGAPTGPPQDIRRSHLPSRIGRPSIDGDRVVYHVSKRTSGKIEEIYLPTRRRTILRKARNGAQLLNPSELGDELLYVRSSFEDQQLRLGPRRVRDASRDRTLYSTFPPSPRDGGVEPGRRPHREGYPGNRPPAPLRQSPAGVGITLWSTALAPDGAYVTRRRHTASAATTVILRVDRE